jgi:hypothetical protein
MSESIRTLKSGPLRRDRQPVARLPAAAPATPQLQAATIIVERIWLSDYLGDDVLNDHSALEQASETEATAVVEAVLQGEAPAPAGSALATGDSEPITHPAGGQHER